MTSSDVEWSISGEYLEACNCDAGCPCKFGADPTKGYCEGILGFHIREGRFGKIDLGGLGFALILFAPASPFKGNLTTKCYLDQDADQEQRRALKAILSGEAGGFWALVSTLVSDDRGMEFAPIRMETSGSRRHFVIPDVLDLTNEPLTNPMTQEEQEVMVSNTFDPFCASGRAGRSSKAVCTDPDFKWDLSGQQGYIGPFEWRGP